LASIDGAVWWLTHDSAQARPLLSELIDCLLRPGVRTFPAAVNSLAELLDASFGILDSRDLDRLTSGLLNLCADTDPSQASNDRHFTVPNQMPDARLASCYLAVIVWKHAPEQHARLEVWVKAVESDPQEAMRDVWRMHSR
jgi:hypothetical protein